MEAIQAATIVPCASEGPLIKEVGTSRLGKRADLIVIHGDPLQDIHNTRNVNSVITNGTMYNAAGPVEERGL